MAKWRHLAAFLALTSASPAIAGDDAAALRKSIEAFQVLDQKVQDIGWRLARSNAEFCPVTTASIGLQLHDMQGYSDPEAARTALGLSENFAVQTLAAGSPAAALSGLSRNDEVTAIAGQELNQWPAEAKSDWKRLVRAHNWIDDRLILSRSVEITLRGGEVLSLEGVRVCASRFVLQTGADDIGADGRRVRVGAGFKGLAYEEDVLAAILAHELAHNIFRHPQWLKSRGWKHSDGRKTELEADRLIPWLLANAGYDPRAALRFLDQYQPKTGGMLFIKGTHPKAEDRRQAILAELPKVEQAMKSAGKADWATLFERGIQR